MAYNPTWSNGNASGRLEAGVHTVDLDDPNELASAINRRRSLTYQSQQDFSSAFYSGADVKKSPISTTSTPSASFDNLRSNLINKIINAPNGLMGGTPTSPSEMDWLWPESGSDENKVIVSATPSEGEINIFDKLNGTTNWTDPTLTSYETKIRAVHFNELRQVAEWLRRGRWELPIYWAAGILSVLPDTPWITEQLGNSASGELRQIGFVKIQDESTPIKGLSNVTVRSSSYFEITADYDCNVELYRCLRPIDYIDEPPTWNEYDPPDDLAWDTAGGTGANDAVYIGSLSLTADEPNTLSNSAFATALQAMVDGAEKNFLVRRSDTGPEGVRISSGVVVDFDLNTPPN